VLEVGNVGGNYRFFFFYFILEVWFVVN